MATEPEGEDSLSEEVVFEEAMERSKPSVFLVPGLGSILLNISLPPSLPIIHSPTPPHLNGVDAMAMPVVRSPHKRFQRVY